MVACKGCCSRSPENRFQHHIFILQPDPSAAEIAFVDILPEADREFLNALDVGRAAAAGAEIEPVPPCC